MVINIKRVPGVDTMVHIPGGDYFFVDPCYIIDDSSQWQKMVDVMFLDDDGNEVNDQSPVTEIEYGTNKLYVFTTQYGDGVYTLQNTSNNNSYDVSVDSGTLALVPIQVINDEAKANNYGAKISLEDTEATNNNAGEIRFADYICLT